MLNERLLRMNSVNFLDDLYGTEEKTNKAALIMGTVFGCFSFLGVLAIANIYVDIITNIFRWYMTSFFLSVSLFSYSSYFFSKKKNKDKCKGVKYSAFIISLALLAIVFLPITVIAFLTGKIKFDYFFPHSTKYIITIFIPMLVTLLVWAVAYFSLLQVSWLNASTIAALISFFVWMWGGRFILFLYHKIGKHRLKDEVYASIKKDLYVCVFVMITFFTIVANCIHFSEPYNNMVKGVTSAFAIYIAFDRLFSKWDKVNKDLEKSKSK